MSNKKKQVKKAGAGNNGQPGAGDSKQADTNNDEQTAEAKTKKVDGIRVTTKRDGFRRGGREWQGTTDVRVDEFTEEQLEQLEDENGNMLVIEGCEIEVPA